VADEELVKRLRQGSDAWNAWRRANKQLPVTDLSRADLSAAKLSAADLSAANLTGANLIGADLSDADLSGAFLRGADLSLADLTGADLAGAELSRANLTGAELSRANLSSAWLFETVFANADLTDAIGLETCNHRGPSILEFRTIEKSNPLPLAFLRGVGLPDNLIDYLPSLLHQAIQFYSCFISYSAKDDDFAKRIHDDLQNSGVRCYKASHDMPIGAKILDAIDTAIRSRDKVLLILSEHSIKSDWVEDEVKKAFEEERTRVPKQTVLFPIRLDDAVIDTQEAWAGLLRRDRNIGDFRHWQDHNSYMKSLERVLRDLRAVP
jgi:hypothetical protein